jgi:hypothetical protein
MLHASRRGLPRLRDATNVARAGRASRPSYERLETTRRRIALVVIDARARLEPFTAPSGAEGACIMPNAVERALRAGPGESNADLFPLRERIRFRKNLSLGLRDVRGRATFRALARRPWQVFIAIACHWQTNAEAWPSQETIASFTG